MRLIIAFIATLAAVMLGSVTLMLVIATCIKRGLKLETIVVVAKAYCFVIIGFFTPLTVGLAQWANSGEMPGPIIWIVTGASCFVGAAGQLLSFLSGSYSDYTAGRKQGGQSFDTQQFLRTPAQPPTQAQAATPAPAQPVEAAKPWAAKP